MILRLCNESCASTVDSTGIVLLPFAAVRQINQLTRNNHTVYVSVAAINSFPDLAPLDRQTNKQSCRQEITVGTYTEKPFVCTYKQTIRSSKGEVGTYSGEYGSNRNLVPF